MLKCCVHVHDCPPCQHLLTSANTPGGLSFTLRVELGPPGQPSGIETFTQVAPVLLTGPRAAEAGPYMVEVKAPAVTGMLASVLPGETNKQLQQGLKTAGHKLANFLARVSGGGGLQACCWLLYRLE
jgi:hypothetical protein